MQGHGQMEKTKKKNISVAKEDDRNKRWKRRLIVDHNYASREQISRRYSALDLNHTDQIALIATSFLWHISKTLR